MLNQDPHTEWEANLTIAKAVPSWQDCSPNKARLPMNEKTSPLKLPEWFVPFIGFAAICAGLYIFISACFN